MENSDMGTDVQCGHCSEIVTVPCSRLAPGAVIADFIILEELGRGGMGIVYLAHQISLDRPAAVKILADSYTNNAEFIVNFIKEARAAAKLNHPHIVQAYAVGEDEGVFYFAMEHIDGETMKQVLAREKVIPVDRAITIIQQIAEALDYAWKEARLVHRDIKPDNIMLTRNGRAKLADLGLSKVAGDIDDADSDEVMGTPQYISPEHLTGAPMDVRSDIYSLGATFYHLITGRFPFEGRTATEIARKHLEEKLVPPQLVNPEIPIAVGQIIEKMMAKNIRNRYQDAESLVEDLRMVRRGKKPPSATQEVRPASTHTRLTQAVTATREQLHSINQHLTGMVTGKVPTGTVSDLDSFATLEMKRQRRRIVHLIAGIAGLVILGIILLIVMFSGGKPKPPPEKFQPAADRVPAKSRPSTPDRKAPATPYVAAIEKILQYQTANPDKKDEMLVMADQFFEKFPAPGTAEENQALEKLLKIYVRPDELLRVAGARDPLEMKYVRQLEQQVMARQRKLEEQRLKGSGTGLDFGLSKERREQEKAFLAQCAAAPAAARREVIASLLKNDYDGAIKKLAPLQQMPARLKIDATPAEKTAAAAVAEWGGMMRKCLEKGRSIYDEVYNGGEALAGTYLEVAVGDLIVVRTIRHGVIDAKPQTGGDVSRFRIRELPIKIIRQLANKAARQNEDYDGYYFFLITQGLFSRNLVNLSPNNLWRKEYPLFAVEYLKQQYQQADDRRREEMKKLFGALPEFREAIRPSPPQ
ncbi:MAG: serine/threonine-protein kinase [Victivallales bacterium]|nr:serine/threonine-protein kinase [Victivallales bacterium]